MASLVRKGPLHGRAPWHGDGLSFADCAVARFLLLRGRFEETAAQRIMSLLGCRLPTKANLIEPGERARLLMLAPSRWMIFVDGPSSSTLLRQLQEALAESFVAVSDASDSYAHIRVDGPRAIELLAAGTAVDLHPRIFGIGHAAQTELARTRCLIWRRDETAYDLLVDASTADYVWKWLSANAGLTTAIHHRSDTG